ncbi:transcriptional regulator YcdC [Escherichia coli]|uniref:Transcriptional regulator YcdC n=1 Tax=Escherichia coli TaxID=562 RepID=A0A376ZUX7_ECOLX|nr:transcriptional regulator YcdC [Escherichia coli]
MTQGAVKTTGKRSRAVSAKKKAILSAALDTFSQFGFHGTRLEQIAELAGVQKPICCILSVKRGAVYCRAAADSRYLAGTVKSVS